VIRTLAIGEYTRELATRRVPNPQAFVIANSECARLGALFRAPCRKRFAWRLMRFGLTLLVRPSISEALAHDAFRYGFGAHEVGHADRRPSGKDVRTERQRLALSSAEMVLAP
jgi:hypothetical protein